MSSEQEQMDAEKAEKSRLADLKMEEMRQKNAALKKRYEEIEADKRNANELSKMAGLKLNDKDDEPHVKSPPVAAAGRGKGLFSPPAPKSAGKVTNPVQAASRIPKGRGESTRSTSSSDEKPPPADPKFNFLDDPTRKDRTPAGVNGTRQGKERSFGRSKPFNFDAPPRQENWPSAGRGNGTPMTKKDMELNMTGSERIQYQNWLEERAKVDAERLARQQTNTGEWRREWDVEKSAKNSSDNQQGPRTANRNARRPIEAFSNQRDTRQENSRFQTNRPFNQGDRRDDRRRPRRFSDSDDRQEGGAFRNSDQQRRGKPSTQDAQKATSNDVDTIRFSTRNVVVEDSAIGGGKSNSRDERPKNRGVGNRRGGQRNVETGSSDVDGENGQQVVGTIDAASNEQVSSDTRKPDTGTQKKISRPKKFSTRYADKRNNSKDDSSADQPASEESCTKVEGEEISLSNQPGKQRDVTAEEGDDDQWEDLEEEDEQQTSPRRRAISEEYHRQGAHDVFGQDEYGGEEGGEIFEDAENFEHSYSSDLTSAIFVDANEPNESMDEIQREMIARLNENIEAVEAALGKHDEDLDVILYGARVGNDVHLDDESPDEESTQQIEKSLIFEERLADVDVDVKNCMERLLSEMS